MARALFVTRIAVVATAAAALACTIRAPDAGIVTAFRFQQIGLVVLLLFWHLPRLVYDAARVFAGVPLPPSTIAMIALVVAEGMATAVLLAATSSATAVLFFFNLDTSSCEPVGALPATCSHWHVAAAVLNLAAWIFSAVVSALMFWLGVAVVEAELAWP